MSSAMLSQISSLVPFNIMSCFRIPIAYSYIQCTNVISPASYYYADTRN